MRRATEKSKDEINRQGATPFAQTYFHGTKADLKIGDRIEAGFHSNYGQKTHTKYSFLSATLDAAIWGLNLPCVKAGKEFIW